MARNNRGRQRIEMKKIKKESNLLVTFSKRRSGLFKKACEFCILCAVQIAVIVFSPAKKVFSFGQPNVETIVNKFFGNNASNMPQLEEAYVNAHAQELGAQLSESEHQLEAQESFGEELMKGKEMDWRSAPLEELGMEHLLQLKSELEELKKRILAHNKDAAPTSPPITLATSSGKGADDCESDGRIIMTPQGYQLVYD